MEARSPHRPPPGNKLSYNAKFAEGAVAIAKLDDQTPGLWVNLDQITFR